MRTILVDNYDSYSYNVFQLMASTFGEPPTVLSNNSAEWGDIDLAAYDAVVISPGPGRPEVRDDVGVALDFLRDGLTPVLGVCLGHQALGWMAGAEVVPAPEPRHGHLETISHSATGLFRGIPQEFTAVRYHSLCLSQPLPSDLEATAWSSDGVIMGVRHQSLPWWGVQFHPESVASEHGAALFANFAEMVLDHRRVVGISRAGADEGGRAARTLRLRKLDYMVDAEVLFDELFAEEDTAFWLDSSRVERGLSRFSFMGDSGGPLGEVLRAGADSGFVEVIDSAGNESTVAGSVFDVLEQRLRDDSIPPDPGLPFDLACGYVGYFGYEMKAECGSPNRYESEQPDAQWLLASRMVAVDHETGQTWVLALADEGSYSVRIAERWVIETVKRIEALRMVNAPGELDPEIDTDVVSRLDRDHDRYVADIEECMEYLHAGESYEICLTNRAEIPFEGSPLEAYRRLRRKSQAPYAAYMRFADMYILCSSPERYLKIDPQGVVESKPIKGTARRDTDPVVDASLRDDLGGSDKTRAENLMIVDLLRNDLGRICEVDSVRVPSFMAVESYSSVHQLVSTIRGRIRKDLSVIDAIRASFPGGSMTGAPKQRTMNIIENLEMRARGIYSGTLGYFGLQGGADFNIVIRTAIIASGRASIGAGGAIVLDSDPEDEFDEMLLKASPVVRAVATESVLGTIPGADEDSAPRRLA
jgi:para-aminobenzoate synthetase